LSETNWVALAAAILIASTVRKVRAGERVLVIRLGQIVGLRGPGKILVIPFIERHLPFKLLEPCEVLSPEFVRISGREVRIGNPEIVSEGRDCFIVEASREGVVLAHSPLASD